MKNLTINGEGDTSKEQEVLVVSTDSFSIRANYKKEMSKNVVEVNADSVIKKEQKKSPRIKVSKDNKEHTQKDDDEEDTLEEDIDNFSVCQERMIMVSQIKSQMEKESK